MKFASAVFITSSIAVVTALSLSFASADQSGSVEPYIDHLKKEMEKPAADGSDSSTSYTEQLRAKLKKEDDSDVDYSKTIKAKLDAADEKKPDAVKPEEKSSSGYTEKEKTKLGPSDDRSAIAAVKEGRSQLEYKKNGDINGTLGLRVGVGLTRNIIASPAVGTGRDFNGVYGDNYAPDLSIYYEFQPFHASVLKNLGFFAMGEVGIFKGLGTFEVAPKNATSAGGTFPVNSATTQFRFFELPVVFGARYGINLTKYVRPYGMLGPSVVGYKEQRNDGGNNYQGYTKGYFACGGISILMDWLSRHDDWDRYAESGIKHTFLTIEYSRLKSTSTDGLDFSVSGPTLGVTFEL